jgi:hypothetical protein
MRAHIASKAVQLGAVLLVAVNCSGQSNSSNDSSDGSADSGAGAETGSTSGGSTSSGSGGTGGASETPSASFIEACRATCDTQAACGFIDLATCRQGCTLLDQTSDEACRAASIAELDCEAALSCSELEAFAENYRGHSECGATYTAFAAACAYTDTPPGQCVDFCDQAEACEPATVVGGCADNCNLLVGTSGARFGAGCASDALAFYACLGSLDCADMSALLIDGVPPESCVDAAVAFDSSCQ